MVLAAGIPALRKMREERGTQPQRTNFLRRESEVLGEWGHPVVSSSIHDERFVGAFPALLSGQQNVRRGLARPFGFVIRLSKRGCPMVSAAGIPALRKMREERGTQQPEYPPPFAECAKSGAPSFFLSQPGGNQGQPEYPVFPDARARLGFARRRTTASPLGESQAARVAHSFGVCDSERRNYGCPVLASSLQGRGRCCRP